MRSLLIKTTSGYNRKFFGIYVYTILYIGNRDPTWLSYVQENCFPD